MEEGDMVSCGRSMIDVFDDNVLTEIFIRLPLKTKFQCKAVCKPWLRLISSPYFAQRVLSKEEDIPAPWFLLHQYTFTDMDMETGWYTMTTVRTFQLESLVETIWPQPEIFATHNGLLLGYHNHNEKLHISNPQTRKEVSLPLPPRYDYLDCKGFIVSLDNGSTKFNVVWAPYSCTLECNNILVFSSEVGEWMDTGVTWPQIQGCCVQSAGVFHDGKLNWIFTSSVTSDSLITFDLDKKECRVISFNMPLSVMFKSDGGVIASWCGRLCFANCASQREDVLSICVLDSYDETGEWRPLFTAQLRSVIDANEIQDDYFYMDPMFFHPFDMNTVYFQTSRSWLVSLNLRTLKFSSVNRELGRPWTNSPEAMPAMFPFVVPPWPTSVPQQVWETKNFSS